VVTHQGPNASRDGAGRADTVGPWNALASGRRRPTAVPADRATAATRLRSRPDAGRSAAGWRYIAAVPAGRAGAAACLRNRLDAGRSAW
jgi:hypothetical protein